MFSLPSPEKLQDLAGFLAWGMGCIILGWILGRTTLGTFRKREAEHRVMNRIEEPGFMPFDFHLISNVTIPSSNNKSSRINHILVSAYGLFVIQVNNRKGKISRGAISGNFVQTLGRRGGWEFNSPVRQNQSHIISLNEFLHLPQDVFHNLVIFTGDCHLVSEFGDDVIYFRQLRDYFNKPREVLFDRKEMATIIGFIEMHRLRRCLDTDEQHRNAIREYVKIK